MTLRELNPVQQPIHNKKLSAYGKNERNKVYQILMKLASSHMITPHMFLVLNQLLFLVSSGRQNPSQKHLLNISGIKSLRTVQKALKFAQDIGLLIVTPQYRRVCGQARRITNHYIFNAISGLEFKRKQCSTVKPDYILKEKKRQNEQLDNVFAFMAEMNCLFEPEKFAIE